MVRPNTIQQLFQLSAVQAELKMPCKCGIETRQYVKGHYGGYFYNRILYDGLECFEKVRKAVTDNIIGGKNINVF